MDFMQNAKKVVDAATGRDPEEYAKRSARANGLPPVIPSGVLTGTGKARSDKAARGRGHKPAR